MIIVSIQFLLQIVKHGGIICNCGSWYKKEGASPLLSEVMNALKPDLVLVIHDEQIYVLCDDDS